MIPTSIGAAVGFLLLAAPGVLFDLLRARAKPVTKETVFTEISRVVLVSAVATVAAGGILFWCWIPVVADLDSGTALSVWNLLCTTALTSCVACVLVCSLAVWLWRGRIFKRHIVDGSVWHMSLVSNRPQGAESERPLLTVELTDGTVWRGFYQSHDVGPEDADPALSLTEPLARKKPGVDEFMPKDDIAVVVLPKREIRSTQIEYQKNTDSPPSRSTTAAKVEGASHTPDQQS